MFRVLSLSLVLSVFAAGASADQFITEPKAIGLAEMTAAVNTPNSRMAYRGYDSETKSHVFTGFGNRVCRVKGDVTIEVKAATDHFSQSTRQSVTVYRASYVVEGDARSRTVTTAPALAATCE